MGAPPRSSVARRARPRGAADRTDCRLRPAPDSGRGRIAGIGRGSFGWRQRERKIDPVFYEMANALPDPPNNRTRAVGAIGVDRIVELVVRGETDEAARLLEACEETTFRTHSNLTSLVSSSTSANSRSQRSLFFTGPLGVCHLPFRRHRSYHLSLKQLETYRLSVPLMSA